MHTPPKRGAPKPAGSLRDFRIDRAEATPVAPTGPGKIQQSVAPLKMARPASNLRDSSPQIEQESLWPAWSAEDEEKTVVPAPVKRAAPAPVAKAPAAPQRLQSENLAALPWSVELAMEERRAEKEGTVDYTNSFNKQELLKRRTQEFTGHLRQNFRAQIELFNESRRSPGHAINLYRVSNTAEDFMLFRNGVKLVVSGQRAGTVIFSFNQFVSQIFAPTASPVVQIEAQWGPFEQLYWSYKSERVQVVELVRYFLTEFVRQSFK